MNRLARRIAELEKWIPEKRVIFISWIRQEATEIKRISSGSEHWVRQKDETEHEFLSRVRGELAVTGPYPKFGFVT